MKRSVYIMLLTLIFSAVIFPLFSDDRDVRYIYTPNGLYLREGPGLKYKKIMLLPYMTAVHYSSSERESEVIDGVAGYWTYITTADEKVGYVFSGYLSLKKKKLEKSDLVKEKQLDAIKKDITAFVSTPNKKYTFKNINISPLFITLERFTESDYKTTEYDESGMFPSITDLKKEKKGFDLLKPGETGKNVHSDFYVGEYGRIIEIKGRKFVVRKWFDEEGVTNFIAYITFINNTKINFYYSNSALDIRNPFCHDIFVKDDNSRDNLLLSMKGKEYMGFFEELVSEIAETAAAK